MASHGAGDCRAVNGWIRESRAAKGLFGLMLLCALSIRLVAPVGFMPTHGVRGLVVTLCTGAGAVKAILPIERDDGSQHQEQKSADCGFAQGVAPGLAPTLFAVVPAAAPALPILLTSRRIADLTAHRLAAPPPPAQGPPARD